MACNSGQECTLGFSLLCTAVDSRRICRWTTCRKERILTRSIKRWAGFVGGAVLLAGCAGVSGPAATPPAPRATCDGAAAQFALGQSFGPELERQVRARSGASVVRWLSPGQAVTMEFNTSRLSLTLDGRGRIVKAACG